MGENFSQKIVVVADGATCTGFRLAGVQEVFPREGKEAEEKITELLSGPETGIIIVNERALDALDWRLKARIERLAKPVVIAVPDKNGAMELKGDSLKNMVKKALGFDLMA